VSGYCGGREWASTASTRSCARNTRIMTSGGGPISSWAPRRVERPRRASWRGSCGVSNRGNGAAANGCGSWGGGWRARNR